MATKGMQSERKREKRHATLRAVETEMANTLATLKHLVSGMDGAVRVRDCKTARLNFDQVARGLRSVGPRIAKAAQLHRQLGLQPGTIELEVHATPAPARAKPRAAAAKKKRTPAPAKKKAPKAAKRRRS